jgi:uncharacterized membrane protein
MRALVRLFARSRPPLVATLATSVLFSVALVLARIEHAHALTYGFLLWNLFLALVPYGTALLARLADRYDARGVTLVLLAVWLLFFPNAPYLVTDLIHLAPRQGVPLWYDLILLVTCAWNGLLLGLLSLREAHELVARRSGRGIGWLFALVAIAASGFGVYLGRFQRWNSWDVFSRPGPLLADLAQRVLHPAAHPRTWAVTVVFSAFLALAYLAFVHATARGREHPAR